MWAACARCSSRSSGGGLSFQGRLPAATADEAAGSGRPGTPQRESPTSLCHRKDSWTEWGIAARATPPRIPASPTRVQTSVRRRTIQIARTASPPPDPGARGLANLMQAGGQSSPRVTRGARRGWSRPPPGGDPANPAGSSDRRRALFATMEAGGLHGAAAGRLEGNPVGIGGHPVLAEIEAHRLLVRCDPEPDGGGDQLEHEEGGAERPDEDGEHAGQLHQQLLDAAPVEKAAIGGEETDGQGAEGAGQAVDGDGAYGVIHVDPIEELDPEDDQNA